MKLGAIVSWIKPTIEEGFTLKVSSFGEGRKKPVFRTNLSTILAITLPLFSLWFLPLSLIFLFVSFCPLRFILTLLPEAKDLQKPKEYGIEFIKTFGMLSSVFIHTGRNYRFFNII